MANWRRGGNVQLRLSTDRSCHDPTTVIHLNFAARKYFEKFRARSPTGALDVPRCGPLRPDIGEQSQQRMLVDGHGGCGDLKELHRGLKVSWASSNSGFACGVESFDEGYEFFPFFNIPREP